MKNYLVDRETLAQFIDQLLVKRPLSASTAEERAEQREQLIGSLDQSIRLSLLNQMSTEQLKEFDALLDRDEETSDEFSAFFDHKSNTLDRDYDRFFAKAGIDLKQLITNVLTNFGQAYLGGPNA